jgi:hypothetical protein
MRLALCLAIVLPFAVHAQFAWKDLGGRMELRENGSPVLVYNYAPQLKDGAPDSRRRCCYVFPLYTPAGVSMLDDFPKDHWHHRGLFWAWPVVETGGKTYDLWMNLTVQPRSTKTPVTSGATLEAVNLWHAERRDIVREELRLVAKSTRDGARQIEFDLVWDALEAPVTLRGSREAGKSYGGFSARFGARESTIVRADGETLSKDEDLTPRRWAELEGTYGGKRAALRITPDPGDPGAPYQWCLRHYGFAGASFPGRTGSEDGYTLVRGTPLRLKFVVEVRDVR